VEVLKKPKTPAGADPVVLQRDGQYASVYPPVGGLVEEFTTVRHVPDPNDGRVLAVPYPLVWPQKDRSGLHLLQTFAGLEPLIVEWLVRHGHRVELTGNRPPVWPDPDAIPLSRLGGRSDQGLLDFVRDRDRGLIRHGPAVDPAGLVAQIAFGWRRARVLVLATRKRDAADFRDRLRTHLPKVSLFAGKSPATAGRVTVATPGYARVGAVGIERRTVLVALDPAEMFPARNLASPIDALRQARRARLYGITPVGTELPPHARSLVATLFGPGGVVVPRHGYAPRGVDVAFVPVEGGPPVRDHDPARLMRSGVWQHPVRNRRLARLAGLIAAGSLGGTREAFPQLVGMRLRRPRGRVVLLAGNVEHALALAGHLPDSPVVCGDDVWAGGLDPEQKKKLLLGRVPEADNKLVIATPSGLDAVGPVGALVRADAGQGLPPLPEDQLVASHGDAARLLVIDCADRHHAALRTRAKGRRAAYVAAGWVVAGEPELSPLDRFLAGRPEVRL
jgi:hypothetical protein